FTAYALGTAVALAMVIFLIFRVTTMIRRLQQPWIESAVMRTAGVVTLVFGAWSLYMDLG
ncbi:MAG: sulfite exporter TauE/SafE family protein, partial [Desulfovibrio sp.]